MFSSGRYSHYVFPNKRINEKQKVVRLYAAQKIILCAFVPKPKTSLFLCPGDRRRPADILYQRSKMTGGPSSPRSKPDAPHAKITDGKDNGSGTLVVQRVVRDSGGLTTT